MTPADSSFMWFADGVLMAHVAIMTLVFGGAVAVAVGNARHWRWVNAPAFRILHLAAIAVIAAEAWCGVVCPLTTLEMRLRARAGAPTYSGSFVEHWLGRLLYYDAPAWVFLLGYTLFAALVVAMWWRFPPRFRPRQVGSPASGP